MKDGTAPAIISLGGGFIFLLIMWLIGNYHVRSLLLEDGKLNQALLMLGILMTVDIYLFGIDRVSLKSISFFPVYTTGILHLCAFFLLAFNRPAVVLLVKLLKQKKIIQVSSIIIAFEPPSETDFLRIKRYIRNGHHHLFGYFASNPLITSSSSSIPYLGDISKAPPYLKKQHTDEIVIMGNPSASQATPGLLVALRISGAEIKLIPVEFGFLSGLMKMSSLNDVPHIKLAPHRTNPADRLAKSLIDKAISIFGLALTLLLSPFIVLLIKSTSRGPVLYLQQRLGKNARPFTLYKFRTMHSGAEPDGPQLSSNNDQRITRGGKTLRYWHLDELPQFWNILKGNMSLVGPRPERAHFARMLRDKIPFYKMIYQVKPGLTSLGMVKYGYASTLEEMADRLYYDIAYINNPSVLNDLKVIAHTLWYIFQKIFRDPKERRLEKELETGRQHSKNEDTLQRWIELKK